MGMTSATIPSLFLRFVLISQCSVLQTITVLISKKYPYLWLTSSFFLIFCSITIVNTTIANRHTDHYYIPKMMFLLLMLLRSIYHQVSNQADKFDLLLVIFLFSRRFDLLYLYHRKHFVIKVLWRHKKVWSCSTET